MTDPVLLRPMVPADEAYIMATWLRDLRDADPSGLPDDLWFPAHRAFIERLFRDRSVAIVIASAADEPTEILGYVVAEPGEVLEWIHVRKQLRGKRPSLARRLLQAVRATAMTESRFQTPLAKTKLRVRLQSRKLRRERPRSPAKS